MKDVRKIELLIECVGVYVYLWNNFIFKYSVTVVLIDSFETFYDNRWNKGRLRQKLKKKKLKFITSTRKRNWNFYD